MWVLSVNPVLATGQLARSVQLRTDGFRDARCATVEFEDPATDARFMEQLHQSGGDVMSRDLSALIGGAERDGSRPRLVREPGRTQDHPTSVTSGARHWSLR